MTDEPRFDLEKLRGGVAELLNREQLIVRLTLEARGADSLNDDDSGHRKVSASPAPWRAPFAHLGREIEATARIWERLLTAALDDGLQRVRGHSIVASAGALRRLPDLADRLHHAYPYSSLPLEAQTDICSLARRARQLLDSSHDGEEPWTKAPAGLTCPYCEAPLWLEPGWSHQQEPPVYCRRCRADDGGHISWPNGAWVLAVNQSGQQAS